MTAVTYGLRPGDYRLLSKLENVEFFPSPNPRVHPSYARIRDFQSVIANWPDNTPVAFWDAGDVLFQGPIDDLWGLVEAHPDELLVVPEPFGYPENAVISAWTSSIRDFKARRRAFELLSTHPFLNAGFVAASARACFATWSRRSLDRSGSHSWPRVRRRSGRPESLLPLKSRALACNSRSLELLSGGSEASRVSNSPRRIHGKLRRRPVHVVHGNAGTSSRSRVVLQVHAGVAGRITQCGLRPQSTKSLIRNLKQLWNLRGAQDSER